MKAKYKIFDERFNENGQMREILENFIKKINDSQLGGPIFSRPDDTLEDGWRAVAIAELAFPQQSFCAYNYLRWWRIDHSYFHCPIELLLCLASDSGSVI